MVKKTKETPQGKIGIVIYTPQGLLIPSAETLRKMKATGKKKK